ncbi:hydantoinase/oxoprolinase family protein, partial [Enterococcus faecalis]
PYTARPKDLVATLSETYALAHGGFEYDGQPLTALDEEELRGILASWRGVVEAIAVIGVFLFFKKLPIFFLQRSW